MSQDALYIANQIKADYETAPETWYQLISP